MQFDQVNKQNYRSVDRNASLLLLEQRFAPTPEPQLFDQTDGIDIVFIYRPHINPNGTLAPSRHSEEYSFHVNLEQEAFLALRGGYTPNILATKGRSFLGWHRANPQGRIMPVEFDSNGATLTTGVPVLAYILRHRGYSPASGYTTQCSSYEIPDLHQSTVRGIARHLTKKVESHALRAVFQNQELSAVNFNLKYALPQFQNVLEHRLAGENAPLRAGWTQNLQHAVNSIRFPLLQFSWQRS